MVDGSGLAPSSGNPQSAYVKIPTVLKCFGHFSSMFNHFEGCQYEIATPLEAIPTRAGILHHPSSHLAAFPTVESKRSTHLF